MGILFLPATLVAALVLGLAGVEAPGTAGGSGWEADAMRWMLTLPLGWMLVVSGFMHTVLARKTAAGIGWETSPFQYELGFVSFGMGIAGIVSAYLGTDAWIPLAIISTVFLAIPIRANNSFLSRSTR